MKTIKEQFSLEVLSNNDAIRSLHEGINIFIVDEINRTIVVATKKSFSLKNKQQEYCSVGLCTDTKSELFKQISIELADGWMWKFVSNYSRPVVVTPDGKTFSIGFNN